MPALLNPGGAVPIPGVQGKSQTARSDPATPSSLQSSLDPEFVSQRLKLFTPGYLHVSNMKSGPNLEDFSACREDPSSNSASWFLRLLSSRELVLTTTGQSSRGHTPDLVPTNTGNCLSPTAHLIPCFNQHPLTLPGAPCPRLCTSPRPPSYDCLLPNMPSTPSFDPTATSSPWVAPA